MILDAAATLVFLLFCVLLFVVGSVLALILVAAALAESVVKRRPPRYATPSYIDAPEPKARDEPNRRQ
jgi:hypothetical protein